MRYYVCIEVSMKTVALYLRTSTELQTKGLDAQLSALKIYCEQKDIQNFEIYQDFGISGARSSRPGLDSMLDQARLGKISQVIVYSFSRFARSLKHLILALEEFQSLEVSFVSITESIDLSTPLGKTIFSIIASIGELEREMIRERVRNGLKAAKARGKILGQPKKHINALPFIELKKSGLTHRQIAKTLNCSTGTVSRILSQVQMSGPSKSNESGHLRIVKLNNSDITESGSTKAGSSLTNQNRLNRTLVQSE